MRCSVVCSLLSGGAPHAAERGVLNRAGRALLGRVQSKEAVETFTHIKGLVFGASSVRSALEWTGTVLWSLPSAASWQVRPVAAHGSVPQKVSQVCGLVRRKLALIETNRLANQAMNTSQYAIERRILFHSKPLAIGPNRSTGLMRKIVVVCALNRFSIGRQTGEAIGFGVLPPPSRTVTPRRNANNLGRPRSFTGLASPGMCALLHHRPPKKLQRNSPL
jgi:hypothetical protein